MPPETVAGSKPRRLLSRALLQIFITALVTLFSVKRFNAAKPQWDVKNTGTTPLILLHNSDSFKIAPAQTWHFRFWLGDDLTIRGDDNGRSTKTVRLQERNMQPGMLSRIGIEVKEQGTNILFQYVEQK